MLKVKHQIVSRPDRVSGKRQCGLNDDRDYDSSHKDIPQPLKLPLKRVYFHATSTAALMIVETTFGSPFT